MVHAHPLYIRPHIFVPCPSLLWPELLLPSPDHALKHFLSHFT